MNNTDKFFLRTKLDNISIKIDNYSDKVEYIYELDGRAKVLNDDDDVYNNLINELSKPFLNTSDKKYLFQRRDAVRRCSNTKAWGLQIKDYRNINVNLF